MPVRISARTSTIEQQCDQWCLQEQDQQIGHIVREQFQSVVDRAR